MGADMSGYCLGRADGQDFQQHATEANRGSLHLNVSWHEHQLFNNLSY